MSFRLSVADHDELAAIADALGKTVWHVLRDLVQAELEHNRGLTALDARTLAAQLGGSIAEVQPDWLREREPHRSPPPGTWPTRPEPGSTPRRSSRNGAGRDMFGGRMGCAAVAAPFDGKGLIPLGSESAVHRRSRAGMVDIERAWPSDESCGRSRRSASRG